MPANNLSTAHRWRSRIAQLHPRRFFLDTWREIDAEKTVSGRFNASVPTALMVGTLCLVVMHYAGFKAGLYQTLHWLDQLFGTATPGGWRESVASSRWQELAEMAWWGGWRIAGYVLIPLAVIKLWWKQSARHYGLDAGQAAAHGWIYVFAYLVMLVLILALTTFDSGFGSYYPMYKQASRSWADLLAWETIYLLQFFALEFFFRGFLLNAMRPTLGAQAIFIATIPYCMIHFGKLMPEALASVFTGVFLGTLALRTRSIWGGFLIHALTALTMDFAALCATRGFPDRWWPT